jgi:hypothetical protein
MTMMEPIVANTAMDHLRSGDMLQTNAVNAYNIVTLYWHARCLLYVMRKHFDLFLLKTLAKMLTHAVLTPGDSEGVNTVSQGYCIRDAKKATI